LTISGNRDRRRGKLLGSLSDIIDSHSSDLLEKSTLLISTEHLNEASHLLNTRNRVLKIGDDISSEHVLSTSNFLLANLGHTNSLVKKDINSGTSSLSRSSGVETKETSIRVDVVERDSRLDPSVLVEHVLVEARVETLARTARGEGATATHDHLEHGHSVDILISPGGTLEAESDVSEALVLAVSETNIASNILRSVLGNISGVSRDVDEHFLTELDEGGVVNTNSRDSNAVGSEESLVPSRKELRVELLKSVVVSVHGGTKTLRAESSSVDTFVHSDIILRSTISVVLLVSLNFVLNLVESESGAGDLISKSTENRVDLGSSLGGKNKVLTARRGSNISAKLGHITNKTESGAVDSGLEDHTLSEVGDTIDGRILITRTDINKNTHGGDGDVRGLSDNLHTVGKDGNLRSTSGSDGSLVGKDNTGSNSVKRESGVSLTEEASREGAHGSGILIDWKQI